MKNQSTIFAMAIVSFSAILSLGGCYTQVGAVRPDDDYGYRDGSQYEDTTEAEEYYDESYPPPNYAATFAYYYPGSYYSFGWCDPWYWTYYPAVAIRGPFYPSYSYWNPYYGWCSPYSYYHPVYASPYYGYYSPGYYNPSPGGGAVTFRDFGNTRGSAGRTDYTRRPGGSPILRSGGADGNSESLLPTASVSRPASGQRPGSSAVGRSGESEEANPPRGAVTGKRTVSPRYDPARTPKTGVSSPPPRSSGTQVGRSTPSRTPAPAAPPSGGTRGSGGSRDGGSRGGGRR